MSEIIIKTQAQLDALPNRFEVFTIIRIKGGDSWNRIAVTKARENSSVEAWGNSSVEAWGNSSVVARENSSVVARENSSVVARGNSSVVARENSSVEAWGNSSVVARENSSVVARGNSSVEAWGNSSVHAHNVGVTLELFGFAAAWLLAKCKAKKRSKTSTLIVPKQPTVKSLGAWIENNGVHVTGKYVTLFKRVSKDYKTQEGTPHETLWTPGTTVTHPNWEPKKEECGGGKFHGCSRAFFTDQYRDAQGDLYVAIRVAVKDVYAWPSPSHPYKVAFREGQVLHRCNHMGKKIE